MHSPSSIHELSTVSTIFLVGLNNLRASTHIPTSDTPTHRRHLNLRTSALHPCSGPSICTYSDVITLLQCLTPAAPCTARYFVFHYARARTYTGTTHVHAHQFDTNIRKPASDPCRTMIPHPFLAGSDWSNLDSGLRLEASRSSSAADGSRGLTP